MGVYVDELSTCVRNQKWRFGQACHLVADTIEELHLFARRLRLRREWFQDRTDLPHYDLTERIRKVAVRLGAVEISTERLIKKMQDNRRLRQTVTVALSVRQPWASHIATGSKTIETRSWYTDHRGPLLICATKRPVIDKLPTGKALAIAELVDCRRMTEADEPAARCKFYSGLYAWVLENIQAITPFAVRGRQGLFDWEEQR